MYSKCNLKMPSALHWAWQRNAAVTLCMVCSLIFMSLGCGNKSLVNDVDDEKESPYYFYDYNGDKVFLTLNPKYAFLSVKEPIMPADILQRNGITPIAELEYDYGDKKGGYKGKPGSARYVTILVIEKNLTDEQYLALLADIKSKNPEVFIAPFFKDKSGNTGGLSNYFAVKLKELDDTALLEQMVEQTGCMIHHQDHFMPLWITLSVTETSEMNAMEYAAFFHECGLFEESSPNMMGDPERGTYLYP